MWKLISYYRAEGLEMDGVFDTSPRTRGERTFQRSCLPHGGPSALITFVFDWVGTPLLRAAMGRIQPKNFRGFDPTAARSFEKAKRWRMRRKMQTDISMA